jgi:hypothetical protein
MKLYNIKYGVLLALIGLGHQSFAGSGFFEDVSASRLIEVAIDTGSSTTYERISQWSGKSFGAMNASSTFELKGGVAYTWENSGDDITAMRLYYRVYLSGSTAPSFSSQTLSTLTSLSGGNEKRELTSASLDLLSNVTSAGTWVVEFYFEADGVNGGTPFNIYFSNGGANYGATFTTTGALGVHMLDFSAYMQDEDPAVKWSTASEYNCSHFTIYSSADGVDKTMLGTVNGQGTTHNITEYKFVASNSLQGEDFFFLEQIDYDGRTEWYGPVKAVSAEQANIQAFFKEDNQLQINTNSTVYTRARLMSLDGKVAVSMEVSRDIEIVTIPGIKSGMYLLELSNASNSTVVKLIK